MSNLKNKLQKIANNESYRKFVADVANLSDDLNDILNDVKNNEDVYETVMADDEKFEAYSELTELNKKISYCLLKL